MQQISWEVMKVYSLKIYEMRYWRFFLSVMYGIMTEERVIREIRIDEAAGRGDSDSRMMRFEVIMPLKLQSTEILIYSI